MHIFFTKTCIKNFDLSKKNFLFQMISLKIVDKNKEKKSLKTNNSKMTDAIVLKKGERFD